MDRAVAGPTTASEQLDIRRERETKRAESGQDVLVDR